MATVASHTLTEHIAIRVPAPKDAPLVSVYRKDRVRPRSIVVDYKQTNFNAWTQTVTLEYVNILKSGEDGTQWGTAKLWLRDVTYYVTSREGGDLPWAAEAVAEATRLRDAVAGNV